MSGSLTGSVYLLGTLHSQPAIILVQRTAIDVDAAPALVKEGLESLDVFLDNRPVSELGPQCHVSSHRQKGAL